MQLVLAENSQNESLYFSTCYQLSTVNGKFSPSTCYEALLGNIPILPGYKQIWCNLALPKHSFIFWLTAQHKLLTRDILAARIPGLDTSCAVCGMTQENHHHLFFYYNFSKMVSGSINDWIGPLGLNMDFENWEHWFLNLKHSEFPSVAKVVILQALVYVIWSNMNGCIFSHVSVTVKSCLSQIQFLAKNRPSLYRRKFKSSMDKDLYDRFSLGLELGFPLP